MSESNEYDFTHYDHKNGKVLYFVKLTFLLTATFTKYNHKKSYFEFEVVDFGNSVK